MYFMNTCFHSSIAGKRSDPLTPSRQQEITHRLGSKRAPSQTESLQERLGCPEVEGLPKLAYTLPFSFDQPTFIKHLLQDKCCSV